MKITRRKALELLATATPVAAEAQAQTTAPNPGSVDVNWIEGAPPDLATGISWGVPFARATVQRDQTFTLTAPGGQSLPLQTWPLAYWPDGSVKFNGFATVVSAGLSGPLRLAPGASTPTANAIGIQTRNGAVTVDTGSLQCRIPQRGRLLIDSLSTGGKLVARSGRLVCSLEDRSEAGTRRYHDFTSDVRHVTVEQPGPIRACIKLEGLHKAGAGTREWLPFVVRLYFYAGVQQIRMVHTIIFDGDDHKDFISGLGVIFDVPMREQVHNRHVHFSGEGDGLWSEPVQPATGRRPLVTTGTRENLFAEQIACKRLPNREEFDARDQKLLRDWAVWDAYKLVQANADGFTIQKRTNAESCWLHANAGRRSSGLAFVGDVSGGLAAGVRNFWQSYPASLEVQGAAGATASLKIWFWSPDAAAMDLRHYDTRAHDLDSSYEDVQPGFSTPHGVARTSEITLFATPAVPVRAEAVRMAKLAQTPPLLAASPQHIHSTGVFGIWSLPDRTTAAKREIEDRLDASFAFYRKEVDQRRWYGFWDFGDVMHQHDGPRHAWRYDVGGFAWDNTELGTDMWLWYTFLRTGRADAFRMAEAMTRHTSEVDTYHLGRFAKLGSRHNVRHWGCGAKEARISQAAYRRFYYYLSTDERVGDIMREVVDVDFKATEIDPMRLAQPLTKPNPYPARVRGGPDWLAFLGNWMTEWERTGHPKYRDKILAGMDSIAALPYWFMTGPNNLLGYEPATGKLHPLEPDPFGSYNLVSNMGGAEVVFELNTLIEHDGWKKAWLQYCRLANAPKDVVARDKTTGAEGASANFAGPGRLAAYVYLQTRNAAFAKRAVASLTTGQGRIPVNRPVALQGPEVLNPIEEITGISTNSVSQGCLQAIEILEMCSAEIS